MSSLGNYLIFAYLKRYIYIMHSDFYLRDRSFYLADLIGAPSHMRSIMKR